MEFIRQVRASGMRRYAPVFTLGIIYLVVGLLLRVTLWWRFGRDADVAALDLLWVLPVGLINDTIQAAYLSLPLTLYLFFLPQRWHASRAGQTILAIGNTITLGCLFFLLAAEYFFFEEFNARFNLVAFDYLMYPTEVIGDIRAEYPLGAVIAIAAVAATAIVWWQRKYLIVAAGELSRGAKPVVLGRALHERGVPLIAQTSIVALAAFLLHTDTLAGTIGWTNNRVATELASNGLSSFFRAANTSEISYPAFYSTRDMQANYRLLREHLGTQGGQFASEHPLSLSRHYAANPNGLGKMNVVVLVEEAFGAEFSKLHGAEQDLTPNFDRYAQQGLWFSNMYASGTRTVRGLEAISASFPPIPSVSILRRPKNENIATWGSVMRKQGYSTSFIYGGYGYFDNMNYFFGHNGFDVIDRTDIDKVRFENIWGVADEDLFDRALSYYDELSKNNGSTNNPQPFFSLVMTTSNHKPFTFREGVPGVPPKGGGRAAGVRYADFAIGYFLDEARKHPWFDNTIFVVVADHGARVYGKAEIPLRSYEIPMLIYAPKHIQPREVKLLTGQIDVAPTVLGLLGLEYDAPFYGTDILACERTACANERVALFSHNHDVAIYRNGTLSLLGLGKTEETVSYDRANDAYKKELPNAALTDLAIAFYQTAYEQFQNHQYQ